MRDMALVAPVVVGPLGVSDAVRVRGSRGVKSKMRTGRLDSGVKFETSSENEEMGTTDGFLSPLALPLSPGE